MRLLLLCLIRLTVNYDQDPAFMEETIYHINVILSFKVLFEEQNCIGDELQSFVVEFVLVHFKQAHTVKVSCLSINVIVLLSNLINYIEFLSCLCELLLILIYRCLSTINFTNYIFIFGI